MNNSAFGKTMENLRKLERDEKKLMKLTSKPTLVTSKIFKEKLGKTTSVIGCLKYNNEKFIREEFIEFYCYLKSVCVTSKQLLMQIFNLTITPSGS